MDAPEVIPSICYIILHYLLGKSYRKSFYLAPENLTLDGSILHTSLNYEVNKISFVSLLPPTLNGIGPSSLPWRVKDT